MHRRDFIKYCSTAGIVLGAGAIAYSWLDMSAENAMRTDYALRNIKNIQGLSETEVEILYLSSLAPSGHNAQPWMITIKEPKRWGIGSHRARCLPAVDPDNRETMLSIGAFMENLSVAARIRGFEAVIEVTGRNNFSSEIAEVRLIKAKEAVKISDREITERRTLRKQLLKSALSEEDISILVGNNKDAVFYYPLNSQQGAYLSQANLRANIKQASRVDAQKELANWIRWSDREALEHRNGLTPESMEIKGIVRWYAKHFLGKKDVLSKTFRDETVKLVEEQVRNCAGWLVVKSENSSVAELIKAGRVLQSTWLRAREKRIAFHPMTQVLEEAPWQTELAKNLGQTGNIQFVIRTGYVEEYLKPVSLRMPFSEIIGKNPDGNGV